MNERPGDMRATVLDVLTGAVASDVDRLRENDPVVREGVDPEGVHQARVACRRLRSQLRTFTSCFSAKETAPVGDELAWLGGLLGEVRDLDVLTERLEQAGAEIEDGLPTAAVIRRLHIERQEAFASLLIEMRSSRYRRLRRRLDVFAVAPPLRDSLARKAAEETLLPFAARRWRAVEKGVVSLRPGARDEELHHVRILAKRARYAAEVTAPFAPAELGKLARKLAKLQKTLGELSDGARAAAWLEQAKRSPFPDGLVAEEAPDPVIGIERLLSREHESLAAVRSSWRESYERARELACDLGWSSRRLPDEAPRADPHEGGSLMPVRLSLRSR